MPVGKISLWSGASGIGKSRLCIDVAKNIARSGPLYKVLYFLTEADLSDFASWSNDTSRYSNIYCSGENSISSMIDIMYEVRPHIIFIDSVNEIEEFENGNKKESRRLIHGNDGFPGLRQVCNDLGCHLILLGQLNQDGKTIKGGTSLPHLVDVALNIDREDDSNRAEFAVSVGVKNRYGNSNGSGLWRHEEQGVVSISDRRIYDKDWCNSHSFSVSNRIEEVERIAGSMTRKKFSFFKFLS